MKCNRCGFTDFGRLDFEIKGPQGPFTRTVYECNRCHLPRGEFLNNRKNYRGHLTSLLVTLYNDWTERGKKDARWIAQKYGSMVAMYECWKWLKTFLPGPNRARVVHALIDEALAANLQERKDISCKAGCAACCYTIVVVTKDEAELLAERVELGVAIDRDRMARQQHPGRNDEAWFTEELKHADRKCLFLGDDNKCRVYEDRPSACRKYFVTTPAKFCDFEKYPHHQVVNVIINEAEVTASAQLNLDNTKEVEFLPVALAKALARRQKEHAGEDSAS